MEEHIQGIQVKRCIMKKQKIKEYQQRQDTISQTGQLQVEY